MRKFNSTIFFKLLYYYFLHILLKSLIRVCLKIEQRTTENILKFPLFYHAKEEIIQSGKILNYMQYIIFNFPTLDFLVRKIKEREFQNYFCCSLPCFSIYSGHTYPSLVFCQELILLLTSYEIPIKIQASPIYLHEFLSCVQTTCTLLQFQQDTS